MGTGHVVRLPRGGAMVDTSAGRIQFGAVPETIKDTLNDEGGVPRIFVIPPRMFDLVRGVSYADLEFPSYFHYFFHQQPIVVICAPARQRQIEAVLREAVFGPAHVDLSLDLPAGQGTVISPDLKAELEFFRHDANRPGHRLEIEDFVRFVPFDREGVARLGDVSIAHRGGDRFTVQDGPVSLTEVGEADIFASPVPLPGLNTGAFVPPHFGITFIGTGHGFDPSTRTSGFILWVDGHGILVDPPVDTTEWMRENGLNPKLIDSVILTHCHADHDSGILQKILCEGRIKLYTTRTVLGSFIRKYRPLVGIDRRRFERLFDFVPLTVGEPIRIHGAEFWFQYTLHSVPTVGFQVFQGGKSLVYTSDTLHDPVTIERMHDLGILSVARRDQLLDFPWHHDLVVHEAGVPPIHTNAAVLAELEPEIKQKLLLVHTQARQLPPGSGLRVAPNGLDETVVLEATPVRGSEAIALLDILSGVDLFRDFPIHKASEFLQMAHREEFSAGTRIIAEGSRADRFYVIRRGTALVSRHGRELKQYGPLDYFGETALVLDTPRTADVHAQTDLEVLTLDRRDFLYFIRGSAIAATLRNLARMRTLDAAQLVEESSLFGELTSTQLTQLLGLLVDDRVEDGQVLIEEGGPVAGCFLLEGAEVEILRDGQRLTVARRGDVIGEVATFEARRRSGFTYRVVQGGVVYRLPRRALMDYLRKNPGVYVRMVSEAIESRGEPERVHATAAVP